MFCFVYYKNEIENYPTALTMHIKNNIIIKINSKQIIITIIK